MYPPTRPSPIVEGEILEIDPPRKLVLSSRAHVE